VDDCLLQRLRLGLKHGAVMTLQLNIERALQPYQALRGMLRVAALKCWLAFYCGLLGRHVIRREQYPIELIEARR
jgi:hypothetical protein